jgi:hypothetical protein
LFKAGHLVDGGAEVFRRESRETDRVQAFRPVLSPEHEPDGGVQTDFSNRTPKGKEFLGLEEHARLVQKRLGKSGVAQDRSGANSQIFQLRKMAARKAKVLVHRFTPS